MAIYARENGQGMAFPAPVAAQAAPATPNPSDTANQTPNVPSGATSSRPQLKRIK